ncbi:MAG: Hpt domain-containing protein [Verrucomicrobiota bacterium]
MNMTRVDNDNRVKQIAVGVGILTVLTVAFCGTLVGWRHVPGLAGEWLGLIVGVMTTPFLLEASFVILGLTVVLVLNSWHRRRSGDDWVELDPSQFLPCAGPGDGGSMAAMSDELVTMNLVHFVKMAYGDVPWLRSLACDFFRETRALIPQWLTLIEARNCEELRVELHRCKGGASLFGFERLVAMLGICESPMAVETGGFDVAAFERELAAAERALAAMTESVA